MGKKKALPVLSQDDYVARRGLDCPYCHKATASAAGNLEADGPVAWQNCRCDETNGGCGKEWTDEFNLVGWSAV